MNFVPAEFFNQYTLLDKADELLKQSDEIYDFYDENKKILTNSQLMMLTELRNLTFFESLSITNTLLRGKSKELKFTSVDLSSDTILFEKYNLHHIRNIFGDHRGKNQKKGDIEIVSGDFLHNYANRITKTLSLQLREVLDSMTDKLGGKSGIYSDNVHFNFIKEMKKL